jgi:UDP-GlcNAc:undecaprenyl-phosphate GlcNAc-1-phosphate transferase
MLKYGLIFFLGAGLCLALTPIARWLALRTGAVDVPGERRIHRQPTARFGGLAIFASMILGVLLATSVDPFIAGALLRSSRESLALVVGASAIVIIGIIDDRWGLGATPKLAVEIAIATAIAASGFCIESVGGVRLGWLELPVTVVWLVSVTNAFNMIDGLDGLAAGVGAMVTATLFLLSLYLGNVGAALILALLGGALMGFLPYNFYPARIFLGDSGSLFVGFVLALTSVVTSNKLATFVAVLVPVLALGLPIAELILTTLRRLLRVLLVQHTTEGERYRIRMLRGPGLFTGDRDHIHHRLLSLGITHRRAVLILYGGCLSLCAGAFGLAVLRAPGQAFLISAVGVVSIVGISRLGYRELHPLRNGLLLPVFDSLIFTKRLVQAMLDLGFIIIAFVAAYLIEHKGAWTPGTRNALRDSVPLVAIVQIGCLGAARLYRRGYRYQGIADTLTILKALALAVTLSAGACVVAAQWWGGHYPGLSVVVLDAYLLATMVFGARVAYGVLDHLFKSEHPRGSRVLIHGTGSAGALALAEIRSNPSLNMTVVGFVDDDREKRTRTWRGVPIYDPGDLESLIADKKFDGLVLSNAGLEGDRFQEVIRRCALAGLPVRRFQIQWPEIESGITEPSNGNGNLPEQLSDRGRASS